MNTYKHKVNYYETDKMGVTHHSNYIRFMEEARVDFLEQIGWGYDKMEEQGIVSPVINVEANYRKTTTYPDVLEIFVQVYKVSAFKLTLNYIMKRNNEIVFTGKSSHCFLSPDGKPLMMEKQYPELYNLLKQMEQKIE